MSSSSSSGGTNELREDSPRRTDSLLDVVHNHEQPLGSLVRTSERIDHIELDPLRD